MRVVFMGTPDFSVPSLQALLDNDYEVVGVFTQPDRPKGRGGKVQMSPVKELALQYSLPVIQPLKIRQDGLEPLRALSPDVCVTAAFGQILSQEVLDVPKIGTVNVHASLLPRHRGSAPVQWAILQGEQVTGVTTMLTDKGIDTGDMLLREQVPIDPEDTAGTLLEKLSRVGAELLVKTLQGLEAGTVTPIPQNPEEATYDPMLKKEMGLLDLSKPVEECICRIRAMSPWPCAWVPLAGENVLKVWRGAPASGWETAEPGTILCADPKKGLVVAAGNGAMELCEIQAPGAKRMAARAFLLGHSLPLGKKLNEVEL